MSNQANTIKRLGEKLQYGNQIIKSSLKESTRATYSLANRDCFVEGQAIKANPEMLVGDYFTRLCDSNTYFISTIQQEPLAIDCVYMYAIKCNCKVTLQRYTETRDINGDLVEDWQTVYKDIKCYKDVATRSNKMTNDGGLDQTIYTLIVPHVYMVSENDRIVMINNVNGEEKELNYKVESIGNQVNGIDLIQLSLDLR